MGHFPGHPTFIDKVNGIVRFIEDPCDAPWLLYIELARKPFGKMVLTLLTFGLLDVIRAYFRPKGLRSGRKGRGRRRPPPRPGSLRRILGKIPGLGQDTGEMVGKWLPGGERVRGRQVSQGVKFFWLVDGVLQRLLWYWLIIDVTATFFYEWTSLIQQSEFCAAQAPFRLRATGTGGGIAAIAGWESIVAPTITSSTGHIGWDGRTATVGEGHYTILLAWTAVSLASEDTNIELRARRFGIEFEAIANSDLADLDVGGTADMIAVGDFTGPKSVTIEARILFGFAVGLELDVYIFGRV